MLKFVFMLIFMVPLSFLKSNYWTVQNLLFFFTFLFMINFSSLNYFNYISYYFGLDMISFGLILLSFWICGLMLMASEKVYSYNNYKNLFIFMILFLLMMLVLTFSSMSVFMFYLFFEASLIPTLFLILGWGYQPERLQAGVYLLFYTLLASLPLLVGIFYILDINNTLSFTLLLNFSFMDLNLLYLSLIFAFLVKMPMFLVHLWLPKAHVEAPVSGSMILAGILLKLGGYGLLRMFSLLQMSGVKYNYWWISISLVGGVLISLICLRQTDLKALIAYSSVAHMGIVLSGLLTLTYWGLTGSYALMIAHGLCSSGLFCLANISYERMGSRSLLINKGLLNFMPTLSLWWFLLCSGNMAAPPTLNLLGEISLLNSIVAWSWVTMIMLTFLSFFSAAYSLYLFAYSQHGKVYSGVHFFSVGTVREFSLLMLHWVPLNILILKSSFCMLWI
uniref:NADH-ubiquinone oxidoreductase chain 4 n=10 Tax=argyritarsis section TaxID=44545 RepID=F1CKC0_9DIPT|nr:NADH dehydrogenase subunit 4 [Anopheles albitarsis]YP_007625583.1 NADH dehydrogenase subunit 4 [Anopheles deaneorum]YP_009270254.1 NADH dehydrogenase subunit 4 [Anopheles oryzalimnetes]AWB98077.1 NADH dehydrogenase subunit 4 [Anopheles marajoara]ADO78927.1 NADH dehydrogenase subunit 4 [Anopheles albitarsis]ADO78947.1 NADH dehydrogenase subunit 4 [Anopheles oryzalimnetes]ADO78973.1 NADH dehydrogenase subunit 4 [Anopheles deaneorum]AWB97947.1 NADH dehydrogenase subunit 4 [Anopheles oryzalim